MQKKTPSGLPAISPHKGGEDSRHATAKSQCRGLSPSPLWGSEGRVETSGSTP
jgi:hypothetical protein